jgi:hypothetical protein
MKRFGRLRKVFLIGLAVLALLVVGTIVAARFYLSSNRAANEVAERLQTLLGGTVRVGSADIGLTGSSSLHGVEAFQDSGQDGEKPWVEFKDVELNASVFDLLRGQLPTQITVHGASINLHFDADGNLLTRLPTAKGTKGQLPRLHIDQGQLTMNQEGRDPMIVHGITLDVESSGEDIKLEGSANDSYWGDWTLNGDIDPKTYKTSIVLETPQVEATMKKLESIPLISPKVWKQVQVEGITSAKVTVTAATGEKKPAVHYRVEVHPHDTTVHVSSIALDADHAAGTVIVEDGRVLLEGVRGDAAGGKIATDADMDFAGKVTQMKFDVNVHDVVLQDLPRSWWRDKKGIISRFNGLLSGKANLLVTVDKGKVRTEGNGEGIIEKPKLRTPWGTWQALPAKQPIHIALHSNGEGFHLGDKNGSAEVGALPASRRQALAAGEDQSGPGDVTSVAFQPALGDDALEPWWLPNRAVDLLAQGVNLLTRKTAEGVAYVATQVVKATKPPPPGEEPSYLTINLGLQDVDLAQAIESLQLKVPYRITGRLTFQVNAAIPVNKPNDIKLYRFDGTASMRHLDLAGLLMDRVNARVHYANGVLDLQELRGEVLRPKEKGAKEEAGTFSGTARVEVAPPGELQARLKIDQVPLDAALAMLSSTGVKALGTVSGNVTARVPYQELSDPAAWTGSIALRSPLLQTYGLALKDVVANVDLGEGVARLTTLQGDLGGTRVTGQGTLTLKGAYPFQARLDMGRADLAALEKLAPDFRLPVEVEGTVQLRAGVQGELRPLSYHATGMADAANLVIAGVRLAGLHFDWVSTKDVLRLNHIRASLYEGEATGSAVVPLAATQAGSAQLRLQDINVQALMKTLPSVPVRLEGRVSGTVAASLAATAPGKPRDVSTKIELAAPRLRVQGIPAQRLEGTVNYRAGTTHYHLQGETLGGRFTLQGDLPPKEEEAPPAPQGQGRLELRGARLSRLWEAYGMQDSALSQLRGVFSLSLSFRHEGPRRLPVGTGQFQIADVSWADEDLTDSLQGTMRLTPENLQFRNVSGAIGGGLFMGQFVFGLGRTQQSWFRVHLEQVEASRLLLPVPAIAPYFHGPVDADLHGMIGPEWTGSGTIVLTRGQVYGLDVTEWRMPTTFTLVPREGTGLLTISDSQAMVARGRGTASGRISWGTGIGLTAHIRLFDADIRSLLAHAGGLGSYASGRVTGRIELGGQQMHTSSDLTGSVDATLHQTQGLQLPILRQITPYLRPGISPMTFQSGELKGRLSRGVFRVQPLTLTGNLLQLILVGTITLSGQLDLDVTTRSGSMCANPEGLRVLGISVPPIGVLPLSLITQASALLANRIVHLRILGTVHTPIVQFDPVILLTPDSIRYFLNNAGSP